MLEGLCKRVTFQTRQPLLRLMRQSFSLVDVIEEVEDPAQFDIQVRLFSLPRLFKIRLDTIPGRPYLHPSEDECLRWKAKLAQHSGLKVGLRWSGSSTNPMDQIRSIGDLSVLMPLREIPVTFVSLADLPILDFGDDLKDFADTAALIAALDLVISVDTGVLNLAGGLGADTWLLNYHGTDWRWGATDDHSPWYPRIRIFRQPVMGDWASVVARIVTAISSEIAFGERMMKPS